MNIPEKKNSRTMAGPVLEQAAGITEDRFLSASSIVSVKQDAAKRTLKRALSELGELFREKKWQDMLAVFYPVEDKLPELVVNNMDIQVREKTAFALGQVNRFDEAIAELSVCVAKEPDNFFHHSSLAYTAYNTLYKCKNREIAFSRDLRKDRIDTAHRHFQAAQQLRPDGVTNFYRQGMLFKQIENKAEKGLPLFLRAVENWERLTVEEQEARHQERKNYIKSLYQLSSALLEKGQGAEALERMQRCLSEDEKSNHLSLLYKYFALGKIHFHLNRLQEARDALRFALQCTGGQPSDFVCELLARTYLALENPSRALDAIGKVPERQRRPYFRWTEADVFCALGDFAAARAVLDQCQERDRRTRHKALIRLSKIAYLHQEYRQGLDYAAEADRFFREKWSNVCQDGLFWQALCCHRLGDCNRALKLAGELKSYNAFYPKLRDLLAELKPDSHVAG